MYNSHDVTRQFEAALCEYTGAPFAVTTTSCCMALTLALAWFKTHGINAPVVMPKYSYAGVPAAIKNAGIDVEFKDVNWLGEYQLFPYPIYDSARRTTSGMYRPRAIQCLSLHWSKILGLSQGGVILHDNPAADAWLRRARFDGRTEGIDAKDDQVTYPSWHAYLSPEVAAHGLMKLSLLPQHNKDLPNSVYPDLSQLGAFKNG